MRAGSLLRALRAGLFAAVCVLLASVGHTLMSGGSVPDWLLIPAWLGVASAAWSLAARERGPVLVGTLTVGTQAVLHSLFSLGQAAAAYVQGNGGPLNGRWAAMLLGPQALQGAWSQSSQSSHAPAHGSAPAHAGGQHVAHGSGHEAHGNGPGAYGTGHEAGHAAFPDTAPMAGHEAPYARPTGSTGSATADAAPGVEGMAHGAMPFGLSGMIGAHLLVALLSAWWLWRGERAVFRAVRAASVRLFGPLLLVTDVVLPAPAPVVRAESGDSSRGPRRLLLSHVIWLRGPPPCPAV